jgi:hypothetical protein
LPPPNAADVNEPSSAVTVCSVESSNFQVTDVPAGTVSVAGVKAKLLISTVDPPAAADPPEAGAGVAVAGDEPDELEQPEIKATTVRTVAATSG